MTSCKKCADGVAHEFNHGTTTGYMYHKCRCVECRSKISEKQRQYRAAQPEAHRTRSREYRANNLARVREQQREHKRAVRSTPEGLEKSREIGRKYFERHRTDVLARAREQRVLDGDRVRNRDRLARQRRIEHYRAWAREYNSRNREQRAEWDRLYRERNGAAVRQRQRDRYYLNWEQRQENRREYYDANRERLAEAQRDWRLRNYDYARRLDRALRQRRLVTIPAPRSHKHYTPEEDAVVLRRDITLKEMCFILGRSYGSVAGRRNLLRNQEQAA